MSENGESKYFDELNEESVDITLEGSFLDKKHKHFLIIARGYVDNFNAEIFSSAIIKTTDMIKPEIVVLDLESVNYIASIGFGQLVSLLNKYNKEEVEFKLVNVNPKVMDVLSLLGFSGFFTILEDLKDYNKVNETIFPVKINCPNCFILLKVPKPGSFKCSGCKNIFRVNDKGQLVNEN